MRRVFVALAFLLTTLAGCTWHSPGGVAQEYIADLQRFDYHDCYRMLSSRDRDERTFHQFLADIPMAPHVDQIWFRTILHATHYQFGEVRLEGDQAFVPVKVTMPDLPRWERTLDAHAKPDRSGSETAQRSLDKGHYPKRTFNDEIVVAHEGHQWRIVDDYADKNRIAKVHREAIAEYHQFEYADSIKTLKGAIAELEKLKATDAMGIAARYREQLADVEAAQAELPAAKAYIGKLKLGDVEIRMSADHKPAIFGTITNGGDKALDNVDLAVTWYEGSGKKLEAVKTETHPVITTPIEFTDFERPVLPFVSGETRRFGFELDTPAQIQQKAEPYVTVSAITFSNSKAPLPKLENTEAARPSSKKTAANGSASPASGAKVGKNHEVANGSAASKTSKEKITESKHPES